MILKNLPSEDKIHKAITRFNKLLRYTLPTNSLVGDWAPLIGIEGDIKASEIFEYVYRCYHDSFKVQYMFSSVINFKNMIVYLFCNKVKINFLEEKRFDNLIGFPNPIEGIKLESIFYRDSLTYKYVNDISECKPKTSKGWQDWSDSHLMLMGGVYWSLISSISLLGMLKRYIGKDYKRPNIVTYPDGVASYVLEDINYERLNSKGR